MLPSYLQESFSKSMMSCRVGMPEGRVGDGIIGAMIADNLVSNLDL